MSDVERTATTFQRRIVELAVAGTAVAVWRGANDAFAMPKLTVLAVAAVGIIAVSLWRVLERAEISLPRGWALAPLAAFLVLAGASVVQSDSTWRSLYGAYGRGTGFSLYLFGAIVLLGLVRSVTPATAVRVARTILVGAGVVSAYGLVQRVGADPWTWVETYGPNVATSTLSNTNFVSGYLGAVLPLGIWAVLATRGHVRWAAIGVTVLMAACLVAARSQSGLVAAAGGMAVLAVGLIVEHGGARKRALLGALGALTLLGGSGVLLGVTGSGPFARLNDTGFEYRRFYWSAAIEMGSDAPLTGVGFDRWGAHYREARSEEAARTSLNDISDAPHSVPLNMFASGGYPLGIAYLAFVASIGVALLVGLRRTSGDRRLLLSAVGAAWVGYQVQSAVSIDVPALPVLHFVLAGLVLVLADNVRWSSHVVAPLMRTDERRISKKNTVVTERPRLAGTPALVIAAIVGIVGAWQLSLPLRADVSIRSGRMAGDQQQAGDDFRRAFDLNGREPEYYSVVGELLARQNAAQFALAYFESALERDPRSFSYTLNAARTAAAADDLFKATEYYERALELEPNGVELKAEAGSYFARIGDQRAIELLSAAVAVRPEVVDWQFSLADAYGDAEPERRLAAYVGVLDQLRSAEPPDAVLLFELVDRLRESGEFDLAHEVLEPMLAGTEDPHTLYVLARIYEDEGRTADAIELYDRVVIIGPVAPAYADAAERAATLRAGT